MATAVSTHYPAPPAASLQISQTGPQDQKVQEVAKTLWQRTKDAAAWTWNAIVVGVKAAGEKISFVAFRILNWIHPSIGPQIEIFYLRVMGIIDSVRNGWKQEEMKQQVK